MTGLAGLDPAKDLRWVTDPSHTPIDLLVEGKIDALMAAPPDLQEARGRVIVSSITDKRWSQYFCYMLATRTEFAQKYPVATKRVLCAILKANRLRVRPRVGPLD